MTAKGGRSAIADALDNPTPAPKVGRRRAVEEEQGSLPLLPPGCPVTPLGKLGLVCHFLDEQKQLISLDPQKIGKNHIRALFGRKSYLCDEFWPRMGGKDGQTITGWRPEDAGDALMASCAIAGIFDPQGRERGRGAHLGPDGELVLHCGDVIYMTGIEDGYRDPGLIGKYVYPTGAELPRPHPDAADTGTAESLLALFKRWEWARSLVDPLLLLGWNAAAMLGGALPWRPHAWVTGSTATGKSTLQQVMELLHDGAALQCADATEAALRQLLRQQTLPVFFDEAEAEEDNRRNKGVTKLARLASSGAQALRGGQDHQGHGFTVRSCFLFSSILLPPMLTQDRNRLAILELEALKKGSTEPVLDHGEINEWGRKMRRRLVDHWPRFRPIYLAYAKALSDVGHSGRGQKQFGTMLALADILLWDTADDENCLFWANKLRADTLAEKSTDIADEEEVADHLATSILQGKGGDEPEPVVRTISRALAPDGDRARERLENHGLRVVAAVVTEGKHGAADKVGYAAPKAEAAAELHLAIANQHVGLARLFRDKRWSEGTWAQSFGRIEGAHRRVRVRFGPGKAIWATLVPLKALLDFTSEAS